MLTSVQSADTVALVSDCLIVKATSTSTSFTKIKTCKEPMTPGTQVQAMMNPS